MCIRDRCGVIVVDLVDPHIGMEARGVQPGAVGRFLGLGHDLAQPLREEEAPLALLEHLPLEEEAGVNVADDLGVVLEPLLQQRQLLLSPGPRCV